MKPDWDILSKEFDGDDVKLIGDVDCTAAESEALCKTYGVKGFPTVMYGDVNNLQEYQGGRDIDSLREHAKTKLVPSCSPKNIDLCDDESKLIIEGFMSMPVHVLDGEISTLQDGLTAADTEFETGVKALQAKYEELQETQKRQIEEINSRGLNMMKAVKAYRHTHDEL